MRRLCLKLVAPAIDGSNLRNRCSISPVELFLQSGVRTLLSVAFSVGRIHPRVSRRWLHCIRKPPAVPVVCPSKNPKESEQTIGTVDGYDFHPVFIGLGFDSFWCVAICYSLYCFVINLLLSRRHLRKNALH